MKFTLMIESQVGDVRSKTEVTTSDARALLNIVDSLVERGFIREPRATQKQASENQGSPEASATQEAKESNRRN